MERYSAELDAESARFNPYIRAVDNAITEDGVISAVRESLKILTHEDLVRLPEDCWPGRIDTRADINDYDVRLAQRRAQPGQNLRDRMLVIRISVVVSSAVRRMAHFAEAITQPASSDN